MTKQVTHREWTFNEYNIIENCITQYNEWYRYSLKIILYSKCNFIFVACIKHQKQKSTQVQQKWLHTVSKNS